MRTPCPKSEIIFYVSCSLSRRLRRGHCPRCYKSQFDIDAAERRRRQCYVDDRSLRSASDDDDWTKEDDSDLVIVKQAPVNV